MHAILAANGVSILPAGRIEDAPAPNTRIGPGRVRAVRAITLRAPVDAGETILGRRQGTARGCRVLRLDPPSAAA